MQSYHIWPYPSSRIKNNILADFPELTREDIEASRAYTYYT